MYEKKLKAAEITRDIVCSAVESGRFTSPPTQPGSSYSDYTKGILNLIDAVFEKVYGSI